MMTVALAPVAFTAWSTVSKTELALNFAARQSRRRRRWCRLDHLLRVEGAGAAGDALHEELRVLPDQDAHFAPPVTASTIFFAPSAIVVAAWMASPL
jgi:hypothetical protein